MTKQEKIQEEWGEDYKSYAPDENGWSTVHRWHEQVDFNIFDTDAVGHGIYKIRPKSLKGVENNNGWIKIESEDDLPNEQMFLECICKGNGQQATHHFMIYDKKYMLQYYSHYKQMLFNPPIY